MIGHNHAHGHSHGAVGAHGSGHDGVAGAGRGAGRGGGDGQGEGTLERRAQRRALIISLGANLALLVAEVIGGLVFHSLALLADGAHLASDVIGLMIALGAQVLIGRPATAKHSFGLRRAEVLGAQINGVLLTVVSVGIIVEAVRRLNTPSDIRGGGVIVVAAVGLAVNLGSAVVLVRAQGTSLNMRAAVVHMVSDALGSVGAIIAGVAVVVAGATRVDPVVSILVALLVLASAWGLLRDTTNVLLEGTPRGIDADAVRAALADDPTVEAVHHIHLWSVASDEPALSAHVVLAGEVTLHEAQGRGDDLKTMLAERFGIGHATLELECHPCEDPP